MINQVKIRWTMLLAPVLAALICQTASAQFKEAAKWVPDAANSLILIRSGKIHKSELAKIEKWQSERSKAFRSGAAFLPPSTENVMLAVQFDFHTFQPIWEVGYFEKSGDKLDILKVSQRTNANLDKIAGKDAAILPSDAYLIKVDDKSLVSMAPGNRQMAERWIRKSETGNPARLSPYLKQAIDFADNNADVIIAFDLKHVISEQEVIEEMEASTSGLIRKDQIPQLAKSVSSVNGLTMGITINDKITGSIKIDFDEEPVGMYKIGKDILISILSENGLMIDDIRDWTTSAGEKQIRISGPLTTSGLRQIGMLIRQPVKDNLTYEGGESTVNAATRTKQYFGDVQHVMDELQSKNLNNLATYAKWFDRYAREIDGISVLGVDEQMLDYGRYVSDSFRDIAMGLRGDDTQRATDTTSQRGFSIYNQNWWGYRYGNAQASYYYNRRSRQIESNLGTARGKDNAKQIYAEIETETGKIRREMAEKYQMDF